MVKVAERADTINFAFCACYNKEGYYCKNWDGKGDANKQASLVKEICRNNNTNPDTCESLVKPILRKGCDWIYQTMSGNPVVATEIVVEKGKVIVKEKQVKETPNITCAECGAGAVYKIEGYKSTYLCKDHAEIAKADGFEVVELETEDA